MTVTVTATATVYSKPPPYDSPVHSSPSSSVVVPPPSPPSSVPVYPSPSSYVPVPHSSSSSVSIPPSSSSSVYIPPIPFPVPIFSTASTPTSAVPSSSTPLPVRPPFPDSKHFITAHAWANITITSSIATATTASANATSTTQFASQIPEIDVCGADSGGISCPGAGSNGYFYRCCSSAGHCGPKNNLQDPNIYCGVGCQAGYGKCGLGVPVPADPVETPGLAHLSEECGPIVNKRCPGSLCCSGSNFCGTGVDYCGAANWCQPKWGACH
ncbi:carbohydrate-binding module family 18 protein [Aulographum hederae CBS 113979]|uniref:Carbohydrate-binding module family 18 protein n=1 Tax=Aulographum hederae CBS 113979 TaxID=1176131 RepID=A0A6G1GZU4_9PEZI|nr:carbohydrate-binding module family 18 protein [Aulographum hederae CBS 113979]